MDKLVVKGSYKNYLEDLGPIIKEYALEEKNNSSGSEFDNGQLMAFHRVISLMQQQAEAFEIPLSEIGLQDFNPFELLSSDKE